MQITLFHIFLYPRKTNVFGGILESPLSVHLCVCVSIQNTSFCQNAGGGIKSHLVTALVQICFDSHKKKKGQLFGKNILKGFTYKFMF